MKPYLDQIEGGVADGIDASRVLELAKDYARGIPSAIKKILSEVSPSTRVNFAAQGIFSDAPVVASGANYTGKPAGTEIQVVATAEGGSKPDRAGVRGLPKSRGYEIPKA